MSWVLCLPPLRPMWSGVGDAHSSFLGVRETRGPALRSPRGTGGYQPSAQRSNSTGWFHPLLKD